MAATNCWKCRKPIDAKRRPHCTSPQCSWCLPCYVAKAAECEAAKKGTS